MQYLGHPSWDFSDFRIVLDGILGQPTDNGDGTITFPVSDRSAQLDKPIMKALLGGTGPLATSLQPIGWGIQNNITPKLIDGTAHTYQVTATNPYAAIKEMGTDITVRENAAGLFGDFIALTGLVTGTFTAAANHNLAVDFQVYLEEGAGSLPAPWHFGVLGWFWVVDVPTLTTFQVSATRGGSPITSSGGTYAPDTGFLSRSWDYSHSTGVLTMAALPDGDITCTSLGMNLGGSLDSQGNLIGGSTPSYPGEVIQAVLDSSITTGLEYPITLHSTKFNLDGPPVGVFCADQISYREVFSQIALSSCGWLGFDAATGKMTGGNLLLTSPASAVYTFSTEILAGTLKKDHPVVAKAGYKLLTDRNWTPQSGTLAGGISETDRAYYAREYLEVVGALTSYEFFLDPENDLTAEHPEPIPTLNAGYTILNQLEADRQAQLFSLLADIWVFETGPIAFLLGQGDYIYLNTPEYTGYGTVVYVEKSLVGASVVKFFVPGIGYQYPLGDLND